MKYHFIVNASASSGKGQKTWEQVEQILKRENVDYQVYFPESREETEKIAGQLTNCHMIVLGGDGTLNAVLQGIEDFEHTKLSCIRTGSGNDFARNMKITKKTGEAILHILHHPKEVILDYGELYCQKNPQDAGIRRRFIISSGIGYDADICEEVSRSWLKRIMNKVHLGKLVYVAIGIKQIFTRKSGRAVIKIDDSEPVRVAGLFFIVGMIHRCEGGGVPFCPAADPSDGQLDICLVQNMPKWKLLLAVMLIYIKKHGMLREVRGFRCRKVTIRTEKPEWFHMDGETPHQIRRLTLICKSGLRLIM